MESILLADIVKSFKIIGRNMRWRTSPLKVDWSLDSFEKTYWVVNRLAFHLYITELMNACNNVTGHCEKAF